MKAGDIIKMSVTLMIVGVVSAIVLNLTHGVTAPLIEEQAIIAIENTMFKLFPEANEVSMEESDDYIFQYALNNEEKIGVATMVTAGGYGGDINLIVAVDMEGTLKGINVISHSETPGIGDVILDEDLTNKFIGIVSDVSISSEVDAVSGATVSSVALIAGVDRGRSVILKQLQLVEEVEAVDISVVPDGTYRGEGEGFLGTVVVDVKVDAGKIISIEEVSSVDEPPEYFNNAWAGIINQVIDLQTTDVDSVSGATYSSKGIKDAVQNALNKSVE